MAIPNYSPPRLTIEQILQQLADAVANNLTPIVIGPEYLLSRYGKETVPGEEFLAAGLTLDYQYTNDSGAAVPMPATHTADQDSVSVWGQNMEAELADINTGSTNTITVDSLTSPNVIRIATVNFAGAGTLEPLFKGRDAQVGDLVYCDDGNRVVKRTVIGLRGKPVASTYGSDTDGTKDDTHFRNGAYNPETLASPSPDYYSVSVPASWAFQAVDVTSTNYNVSGSSVLSTAQGLVNAEEYTITVQTGGTAGSGDVRVNITSKSGLYTATNYAPTDAGGGGGTAGDFRFSDAALAGTVIDIRGPSGASSSMTAGQVFKIQVIAPYEQLDNTQIDGSDAGSGYTGPSDTTYVIKVKTGTTGDTATGAVVTISDTAGIDEASEVTVTNGTAFDVGTYGVRAAFDVTGVGAGTVAHGGLRAGDTFYVHAVAATESTTEFNGLTLDGPAVDTSLFTNPATTFDCRFRVAYSGDIPSTSAADGTAWTTGATGVTIQPNMALEVAARDAAPGDEWVPFVDSSNAIPPATTSMLYASWRALVPAPETEDKILISSTASINENHGTIDLDNDLAFGANECFDGSGGIQIYTLRTGGTTVADYAAALKKIESTDGVYAICALSDDIAVQAAVGDHCEAMSNEEVMNFRRGYFGTDSPGKYAELAPAAGDPNYTATVSDYNGQGNLLVTSADSPDFTTLDISMGDEFRLTGSSDATYLIASVISSTELLLQTGPASAVSPAEPFEIWRADTAESQADYVIARSTAIKSRRMANVWVENGTRLIGGVQTVVPNRYVAAYIAGLRCSVAPQQGLSHTIVSSVTRASAMYVRYNKDDLNRVASNGTYIITQDAENGDVFIRHQLTTETEGGSLYYEDSVGTNVDEFSFQLKAVLDDYVGRKNVTRETLDAIYNDAWVICNDASKSDRTSTIGPQIVGFRDPVVEQDSILADRVNLEVDADFPLPLNHLAVTVRANATLSL